MATTSGRVSVVIGGVPYSARGEVTLNPSKVKVDVDTNQDGSIFRTVSGKPISASVTFDKGATLLDPKGQPMKWDDSMMLVTGLGVTFTEAESGRQHLLSQAFFTGDPAVNLKTGEVSGLEIAAETYETIA